MKKLIFVFGVFVVLALSSCNRNGCPNKLDAEQPMVIEEVE